MLGAVLSRAEAQVIRMAMIYAVLDNRTEIDPAHLRAALAVWEFCEESARQIFGDALGDPIADTILAALRAAGPGGKSRAELLDLFSRNQSSAAIRTALVLLVTHGYARSESARSAGRGRPIFDVLEVPQRNRRAGACRRLAKLMTELGWTAVRVRGLTRGGYLEQVRGYCRRRSASFQPVGSRPGTRCWSGLISGQCKTVTAT
jgi:hypothetical protein